LHFSVGYFILAQVVLKSNLVDLINCGLFELVGTHIYACDVLVALKGVLQSCRVAVCDLVAADV